MWEFEIMNKETHQTTIVFGYSLLDAFKRTPSLNSNEWECVSQEYID
jgi:hypothetical protein